MQAVVVVVAQTSRQAVQAVLELVVTAVIKQRAQVVTAQLTAALVAVELVPYLHILAVEKLAVMAQAVL
jgi:hypothetical protein